MLDQLLQDPIGTLKAILELGWPAIVLVMVVTLWIRINNERDRAQAALNGHVVALEAALDRCHNNITDALQSHNEQAQRQWGEAITQAANATAIGRQNREDLLIVKNILTGASG